MDVTFDDFKHDKLLHQAWAVITYILFVGLLFISLSPNVQEFVFSYMPWLLTPTAIAIAWLIWFIFGSNYVTVCLANFDNCRTQGTPLIGGAILIVGVIGLVPEFLAFVINSGTNGVLVLVGAVILIIGAILRVFKK